MDSGWKMLVERILKDSKPGRLVEDGRWKVQGTWLVEGCISVVGWRLLEDRRWMVAEYCTQDDGRCLLEVQHKMMEVGRLKVESARQEIL